jgi:DNA-binding ferritin-like protein
VIAVAALVTADQRPLYVSRAHLSVPEAVRRHDGFETINFYTRNKFFENTSMKCVLPQRRDVMSTQETVRQRADTVEGSEALRIDADRAEQLVDALNTDLAATYVLYHQLKKHHWVVEGAEFRDLHLFLGEAAEEAEEFADELAERAQALGGVPVTGGKRLEERAPVDPEGDDVYDIRTSLANDMAMYGDIIETLRDHVDLAQNLGDHATAHILRENLIEVEEAAHHIEHYLEDDSLVLEETTH